LHFSWHFSLKTALFLKKDPPSRARIYKKDGFCRVIKRLSRFFIARFTTDLQKGSIYFLHDTSFFE